MLVYLPNSSPGNETSGLPTQWRSGSSSGLTCGWWGAWCECVVLKVHRHCGRPITATVRYRYRYWTVLVWRFVVPTVQA